MNGRYVRDNRSARIATIHTQVNGHACLNQKSKPGPELLALASLRVGLKEEQGGKGRRKYARSEPARPDGNG